MLRQKLIQRDVAQVLLQIYALAQILRVDFRHRKSVPSKTTRELDKRDIFFAHAIQNPDRRVVIVGEPNDPSPRAAEITLQRLHPRGRSAEVLLEELLENVRQR